MNVLDAMAARHSVRTFGQRQPPRSVVESILRNAARAPSCGNSQPWRVRVLTGETLADVVTAAAAGESRLGDVRGVWAQHAFGQDVDVAAVRRGGLRFYEAPIGLLCSIDRDAAATDLLGHGCFVFGIDLAAIAFGVNACIIGDFGGLDDLLADAAGLDLDRERITVGIGLGYADQSQRPPIPRAELDSFASFAWS